MGRYTSRKFWNVRILEFWNSEIPNFCGVLTSHFAMSASSSSRRFHEAVVAAIKEQKVKYDHTARSNQSIVERKNRQPLPTSCLVEVTHDGITFWFEFDWTVVNRIISGDYISFLPPP